MTGIERCLAAQKAGKEKAHSDLDRLDWWFCDKQSEKEHYGRMLVLYGRACNCLAGAEQAKMHALATFWNEYRAVIYKYL